MLEQQENQLPHVMRVKKRDGTLEPVDVTKIVERVTHCCQGLGQVDPLRVATKAISGLYDGASTKELDNLCIQTASLLIGEEPEYSKLASRLLSTYIDEEVRSTKIRSFADAVTYGFRVGLLSLLPFWRRHAGARPCPPLGSQSQKGDRRLRGRA